MFLRSLLVSKLTFEEPRLESYFDLGACVLMFKLLIYILELFSSFDVFSNQGQKMLLTSLFETFQCNSTYFLKIFTSGFYDPVSIFYDRSPNSGSKAPVYLPFGPKKSILCWLASKELYSTISYSFLLGLIELKLGDCNFEKPCFEVARLSSLSLLQLESPKTICFQDYLLVFVRLCIVSSYLISVN